MAEDLLLELFQVGQQQAMAVVAQLLSLALAQTLM
jgi:hypothetical protein